MKPERGFVAERALAQHCSELLRPAPQTSELLAGLQAGSSALAHALARALAPLFGGDHPVIEAGQVGETGYGELVSEVPLLAAHCLLTAGKERTRVLVSVGGDAVLRLVDRAFGGKGTVPSPLPQAFPMSAEMMIARLEAATIAALGEAWGLAWPGAITPLTRNTDLAALGAFADAVPLAQQRFTVRESGAEPWTVTLAMPLDALADLVGEAARSAPLEAGSRIAANPADLPYGALPLTLEAVLVDMAMPVSAISALVPGQVLPVSVARNVPLKVGGQTIANGTIGALDERVAVRLIQAF